MQVYKLMLELKLLHAELNKRFVTTIEKQRPYIILKWAETADGFLAPKMKIKKRASVDK